MNEQHHNNDRVYNAYLVLVRATHHVEKQVHVALVETRNAVQHDDFRVGPVRAVEEVFLECLLLLDCGKHIVVVVLGQYAVAVVVQNSHALDGVQSRFLSNVLHDSWIER